MFCHKCGNKLTGDSVYCSNCGHSVDIDTDDMDNEIGETPNASELNPAYLEKRKIPKIFIILSIIFGTIGAFIWLILLVGIFS